MNKETLRKLKYYLYTFWFNLKKLFTFIQSNADIFIALLPKSVSEEIKFKIKLLLSVDKSGVEKQREIVDWMMNNVLIRLPKKTKVGEFYWNIPESTRKHLVNMVVTKLFTEVQEEIAKLESFSN